MAFHDCNGNSSEPPGQRRLESRYRELQLVVVGILKSICQPPAASSGEDGEEDGEEDGDLGGHVVGFSGLRVCDNLGTDRVRQTTGRSLDLDFDEVKGIESSDPGRCVAGQSRPRHR